MQLPVILVSLSDVLPSKNKGPRTGKAWAKDPLEIRFQGIEYPLKSPDNAPALSAAQGEPPIAATSGPSTTSAELEKLENTEEAVIIAQACLTKPMPPRLGLSKKRLGNDIVFHPTSGRFAFQLHTKIGQPVINTLVERLQRVEQLVDFVGVVQKHTKTLHCQTVSLGQIIFSYGSATGSRKEPTQPDAMAVDPPNNMHDAIIEFSGANVPMVLSLNKGNPHLRVLDFLTKVLNSKVGLNALAKALPLTLPLMTALNAIEEAWAPFQEHCEVFVLTRSMDCHVIRYNIADVTPEQKVHKVVLEVKLNNRRGRPWWCVRREKERERSDRKNSNLPLDTLDTALKAVWEDNFDGDNWRGMVNCGIGRPEGVEELLNRVDLVIRDTILKGPPITLLPEAKESKHTDEEMRDMQARLMKQKQAMQLQMQQQMQANQAQQLSNRGGRKQDTIVID